MISLLRLPAVMTYRVEVSGWDSQQNFFVTKAELQWYDDNGKQIVLSRSVSNRSILFVRLLHATDLDRALPVPYEAELLESASDGLQKFRLHSIRRKGDRDFPRRQRSGGE